MTKRFLIIPDIHQHIQWAQNIIDTETGNFDEIIFLGDFWDAKNKDAVGIKQTSEWIHKTVDKYRSHIVMGNHDANYYSVYHYIQKTQRNPKALPFYASGYTNNKAKKIAKYLNYDIIQQTKLVLFINNHLISHAGVLPHLLTIHPQHPHPKERLQSFLAQTQQIREAFPFVDSPIFQAGKARGGKEPKGGITWADWHEEFENATPWPQIVGHTYHDNQLQKENSYNLDGHQTTYGILTDTLQIKTTEQ